MWLFQPPLCDSHRLGPGPQKPRLGSQPSSLCPWKAPLRGSVPRKWERAFQESERPLCLPHPRVQRQGKKIENLLVRVPETGGGGAVALTPTPPVDLTAQHRAGKHQAK